MNSEELKKEFGLLMPSEINGFKRPDESISSSNDFFLEIPQLISKDPVLYSTMNLIFSVILSNDKLLKQWIDTLQNVVNAQDWRIVTDTLKGYMTPELKKKLDGIATGANNYVHPANHPATMITQDATHRFVTDTEKTTWNAKASTAVVSTTANGLAPKRDGNASHFLAGDGSGIVVPSASSAATATKATQDSDGNPINTTYLKRSGGTMSGALNLANNTLNLAGDDCYFGDQDIAGGFCLRGANGTTNLTFINKDNTTQMASLFYAGGNLISNAKIQANLAGTADKATNDSSNRNIVNTYATKTSPAFSGTPTAPTAGVSVNNTQIATTAFAQALLKNKFTISKNSNGWWKDNNTGLLIQWGTITASVESETYYMYGEATFPLTFGTVYNAIISHEGFAPTGNCINGLSNTQLKINLGTFGVTPQDRPWNCRYIAIGLA